MTKQTFIEQIKASTKSIKCDLVIKNINIVSNKEDINTIIVNLIDNAIKYTAGKEITVKVYEDDYKCITEVSNEIYEIPEKIKDNLFDPFVKHSNDIVLKKEGITSSGLGLYICNKLAEDNNLKLEDVIGLDYDDPQWDTLLDQLTVSEMDNLIALGGYTTAAISSVRAMIAEWLVRPPMFVTKAFTKFLSN